METFDEECDMEVDAESERGADGEFGMDIEMGRDSDLEFEDEILIDLLLLLLVLWIQKYNEQFISRCPVHDDPCRGNRIMRLMLHGHYRNCFDMCRMMPDAFMRLCEVLRGRGLLRSTHNVTVEEQVRIFLQVIGHNDRNRAIQHLLHHSGETISRYFREVLHAICLWSIDLIKPRESLHSTPRHVIEYGGGKYWPFFRNCIGALDGTHAHVIAPKERQLAFRSGRNTKTTQNVLAICDFDMRYTFVSVGWEGTAHDAKVLAHAIYTPGSNFPMPPNDKYYVVDAGYPNRKGFLAPYKSRRYHIPEFQRTSVRGKEELFNKLHSSLRNIIERSFGLLKKRWPILDKMPSYSYMRQVKITLAAMTMHNFIIEQGMRDELVAEFENLEDSSHEQSLDEGSEEFDEEVDVRMAEICDNICNEIAARHGIS